MDESRRPAAAGLAAFQEALAALRQDYVRQLPARLQELADALGRCRTGAGERDALEELRRLVHTMKGTAGTLGLAALSADAADIERLLEAAPGGPRPQADGFASVAQALEQLLARHGEGHA